MKIGVFGLGSMGYGMAISLVREGYEVYGFDINQSQIDKFASVGGLKGSLMDVAPQLDMVVVVVLNALQTESVLFGDKGVVNSMKPGSIVVSCATVAPDFAKEMAKKCGEGNVSYLDAPISGGALKAEQGQLSMMVAADKSTMEKAMPVLNAMSETVFDLGEDIGAGSAIKAVNQLLAGVHIASMAEAITFGMTQGIKPATIVDVISKCAGTSWMFENRAPHIVEGDYSPRSAIDIWLKDLGIILDIAKGAKFSAPLTATALQQFIAASGSGLGQEDDSAVVKVYARNANIDLEEAL